MPNGTLSRSTDSTSAPDIARRLAHWRARIERRRAVQEFKLCVPGAAVVYRLTAPADPDAVLDETISTDPHIPYWATPWASGMALAEVALARLREVVDLRALDLGCGLGLTATALAEAGASVSAVDCFAESLTFARYNVLRNTGRTLRTHLMDWRTARGVRALAGVDADLVVAADVLYEPEDVEPVLALGGAVLGRGGSFWLAEPGRATSARFLERAKAIGWAGETITIDREWPAVVGRASVRVHLFQPH